MWLNRLVFSKMHSRSAYTILGRRFALTATAYKYLNIDVEPMSFVEMLLGDNKGNQIILPYATWETFIAKRADIEKLSAVNRTCIIIDSRSGYRPHKNTRCRYYKTDIV